MIRLASDHDEAPMRHAILAALVGATLLAGCGGDDDDGAATPKTMTTTAAPSSGATGPVDTLKIADFVYDPAAATVRAGQRISVPNADAAPHTITDGGSAKAFDSGTIKGRSTGSLTIDKPGTYSYISASFTPS